MIKKFYILILSIFIASITSHCFATETTSNSIDSKQNLITFIYLNGSNDLSYKNRLKFKETFEKDVNELHPKMIEGFENDALIKRMLLQNGKLKINPTPIIFYWGD